MTPRWLLPGALFASLALNVFIAGAFVGMRLPHGSETRPDGQRNPVSQAIRTLPPEQQAAWRAQMPEFQATFGPRVREGRRLRRDTLQSLGAEPFDAEAKLAELAQARALEQEGRAEMDRRLVTFAAGLPQDQRAKFGEALARPASGRRGAGHDRRMALPDR